MATQRIRTSMVLDAGERFLQSQTTRLVLSFLIVLSVLPDAVVVRLLGERVAALLPWLYISVFGPEVLLRSMVLAGRVRECRAGLGETAVMFLDVFALISFLPLDRWGLTFSYLRLFRLARLLLLLGYWGRTRRELAAILAGRDRRGQVVMVILTGLLLSSTAAVVLTAAEARWDFDGDGVVDADDQSFFAILWWSFRQVEDPGNLVAHPDRALMVVVSLLLTFSGLLLFSFLIGVGTGAVDELLERSRVQPVGLRGHTVVLGVDQQTHFLLRELAEIYRKNFGAMRAAALGRSPHLPDNLRAPHLGSLRYRCGETDRIEDLERLDLGFAKRALVLGPSRGLDPDAHVVSSVLAVRSINPDVDLFPVLEHEKSFAAVRAAGGPGTHVVGAGSFVGFFLAQNVVYPGISPLYRQLLSSAGCEIYTYLFSAEERSALDEADRESPWLDTNHLVARAFLDHGVTLLGVFLSADGAGDDYPEHLDVVLGLSSPTLAHPALVGRRLDPQAIAGLIGISLRFEDLRALAGELVSVTERETSKKPVSIDHVPALPAVVYAAEGPARHLLICGGSPRVPRILNFLAESYEGLEATVLIRDKARISLFLRELEMALQGGFAGSAGTSRAFPRSRGKVVSTWFGRRVICLHFRSTFAIQIGPISINSCDTLVESFRGLELSCSFLAILRTKAQMAWSLWIVCG